ncbi:hypothetical protein LH128_31077 [Sphingomonas sp. LH128]|uniref:hypothetical protein n=1 Tax=Sphingomonas sp. LH128 TaxID=473781 RepID=UPI00027C9D2A|nr:hypothetical protein [Sphingomonas sp. LH128]EJU09023.1 hypothetical protein LH128_31077 [Sphingomonas sp. LH128]
MTKETNSRSYSSFAELAKAIGTTPAELRKQYLDKAIADTMNGEQEAGTAATPDEMAALARQAEIADMIAQDSVLDSFTEAFGDVTALSILDMGGERQELDMPSAVHHLLARYRMMLRA